MTSTSLLAVIPGISLLWEGDNHRKHPYLNSWSPSSPYFPRAPIVFFLVIVNISDDFEWPCVPGVPSSWHTPACSAPHAQGWCISITHYSLGGHLHFWAVLDVLEEGRFRRDQQKYLHHQLPVYVWLSMRARVLESGHIWSTSAAHNPNYVAVSKPLNPLESLFPQWSDHYPYLVRF